MDAYDICTNLETKILPILLPSMVEVEKFSDHPRKTNEMHISQIYFWNRTLHVSDRFSVQYQDSSTVYTAIGICHTGYADCLLASSHHNLYDINLLLCVQY
jgi:hypothetical protein